jgi:hypothetical protein
MITIKHYLNQLWVKGVLAPLRDFKKTKFRSVGIKIFLKLLLFPPNLDDLAPEFVIKIIAWEVCINLSKKN